MFNWVGGWFGSQDTFCKTEFKTIWTGFIDAVADSAHAHGPAATPPRDHSSHPARRRWEFPAAKRLVAIGDVHGDMVQMKKCLMATGLVDENLRWIGNDTVAVQVGDQLDRGDHEIAILYTLERLQREAERAGGAFHIINGNHETMNIACDFRYATSNASDSFVDWASTQKLAASLKRSCGCSAGWSSSGSEDWPVHPRRTFTDEALSARASALSPGGTVTRRFFTEHPMVLKVGSSVFVHGGLHPEHIALGVPEINAEAQDWMEGSLASIPQFVRGREALVWSRHFSHEQAEECKCDMLRQSLRELQAQRMIVGHTIQKAGVNTACEGQVVRVDVGMSWGCGYHKPQALEIIDDKYMFRVLEDGTRVPLGKHGGPVQGESTGIGSWFARIRPKQAVSVAS